MSNLFNGLNEAQRQAVAFGEGAAMVLAAPGSGKTTISVKRILYLIQIRKIPPEEILMVTFTKEAALSMQNRFQALYAEMQCDSGGIPASVPVNFGTFHSVFYHILIKSHYPATNQILSVSQKREIMQAILKERAIEKTGHYEFETLKARAGDYLTAVGFYKNTLDTEKAKRSLPAEEREDFSVILQRYREKCREAGGLDFDDMVYECRELLTRDKVIREYWQERFRYILVDEFQDINPMQYEVLKLLGQKHGNVFAVGDEDQAIYGFRGSDPDCVRRFVEEYDARQIVLNANYRSTEEIVALSEKVIAENKSRFLQNKGSYAAGKNAGIRESVRFASFETRQEELSYLKERLQEMAEAGNGTCGVLFRTNSAMQSLAVQLSKAGIPFEMKEKTGNPYDHFIMKDIMAYLKLAQGDCSREHFLRIMNRPLRYISRECAGENSRIDLARLSGQNGRADRELQKLKQQLARMRGMPPALAVQYVCKAVGYEVYLSAQKEAGEHLEEWLQKLDFYKEDAKNYPNVAEWERAQRLYESRMKECSRSMGADGDSCIFLMTVHASKGLEFDRVYLPDCNEKYYPHGSMPDADTVEEERRIFYVAMTRAKKHLELLCTTGTKERPRLISRFLNPIIHQLTHQTHCCPDTHQKHP
ncbi:MAG: ATP-dependent helicase [Lachnospiraceae bacterium]|nr:ATP-dependent helicase [Lachnospiraceae bacterium]